MTVAVASLPPGATAASPLWLRLLPLSWAEWRHHPWRHAVALLAVALGVALAASVQVINHSALGEFAQAVRAVNGEPDVVLAAQPGALSGLDDALLDRLVHQAYRIELKGESMRKTRAPDAMKATPSDPVSES